MNMKSIDSTQRSSRGRFAALSVLALGLTLGLSACDETLEVTDPDRVSPGTLNNADAIPILVASAVGEFQVAYSGSGGDAFVSTTAAFTDEFMGAGTFPTRTRMDQRNWFTPAEGNTADNIYINLQQARRSAILAHNQIDAFLETRSGNAWGEMRALEAYTLVAFGEAYCGAVPLTEVDSNGGEIEGTNSPVATSGLFEGAITRFDDAVSADASLDMARIGKARALMSLGRYSEAASAVSSVATTYVYWIEHGATDGRQENGVEQLQSGGRYTVTNGEGAYGPKFRDAMDPRVPWRVRPLNGGLGFDGSTPQYDILKYQTRSADLVLADGVEARLIEAEAAYHGGSFGAALTILNSLRAQVAILMPLRVNDYANLEIDAVLAPLTDPGSSTAQLDMIMNERVFWLYATGHRQGDLRRMVRVMGRSATDVYPSGAYVRTGPQGGGTYGSDVAFPIDFDEQNNPEFQHSMCVVGTA